MLTSRTLFGGALAGLILLSDAANAGPRVRGYTKSNGTYVAPHFRTAPNRTRFNNYSTRGNVNPYTGRRGTRKIDQKSW